MCSYSLVAVIVLSNYYYYKVAFVFCGFENILLINWYFISYFKLVINREQVV